MVGGKNNVVLQIESMMLNRLSKLCVLALLLTFSVAVEAKGNECAERLFFIKGEVYEYAYISTAGNHILLKIQKHGAHPDFEPTPGGIFRLYSKEGVLLWEKEYANDLYLCSNENYLKERASVEFESAAPQAIYDLSDGGLFFRMPDKALEANDFDVSKNGKYIITGLLDGRIILFQNRKIVWEYFTGVDFFVNVAFSKNGNYFMEDRTNSLFSFDKNGVVKKIDARVSEIVLKTFDSKDFSDAVLFVFPGPGKIYKYVPEENTLYFLNLSQFRLEKKKKILSSLKKRYPKASENFIFSDYLGHLGVLSDKMFDYYKIDCN